MAEVPTKLRTIGQDFEIVIIEDGSPDNTAAEADVLASEYPEVRVVHHESNRGYGGALRSGFHNANTFDKVTYTAGRLTRDPGLEGQSC